MSNIVAIDVKKKPKKPAPSREEAYQHLLEEARASSQLGLLPNNDESWEESVYELMHSGMLKLTLQHLFMDSRTKKTYRDELISWVFSPLVQAPTKPVAFSFQACCGIESRLQKFAFSPIDPAALQKLIADKLECQHDDYEPLKEIMAWFEGHNREFNPGGKNMTDIHEAFQFPSFQEPLN